MFTELSDLNFKSRELIKMKPSLLAARDIYYLNFKNYVVSSNERNIVDPVKHLRWIFF